MNAWMKSLKNLMVLTYDQGRFVGLVQELYIQPETKKITGFKLKDHVMHTHVRNWLSTENIKKVGEDVMFIASEAQIEQKEPDGVNLNKLEGIAVSTLDGQTLGRLDDLEVDTATWALVAVGLENNKYVEIEFDQMVLGQDMILLQKNAIVEYAEKPIATRHVLASIFGREFINKAGETIRSGYESVKKTFSGHEADLQQKKNEEKKSENQDPVPQKK